MSQNTFHTTTQDLRKAEANVAHANHGKVPKDSEISQLKSVIGQNTDKSKEIEEHKANLPLPEQPPVASDWQSADQRTVNVGSGRFEEPVSGEGDSALRGPATASSSVRRDGNELHQNTAPLSNVGRQAKDNLGGLPKDALYR